MTDKLSDKLEKKITQETYGLFPTGVTRYQLDNSEELKEKSLIVDEKTRKSLMIMVAVCYATISHK